jgi:hypothetical protein
METTAILLLASALFAATPDTPLEESEAALVFLEPFTAADQALVDEELHSIAQELFHHALAATKKFTFAGAPDEAGVELVIEGRLRRDAAGFGLELTLRQGGERVVLDTSGKPSLQATVDAAAAAVAARERRTGYVLKRDGDRLVIARGAEEGIAVGQRYRTTDTGEEFEIVRVAPHTADGRIVAGTSRAPAASEGPGVPATRGNVGAVDIVFLIDTTTSMQQEIDGVLANCGRMVAGLAEQRIDASLSLVTFGEGVQKVLGPTTSPELFQDWLRPLRADGGGDETPFIALEGAGGLRFRPGARRVYVLITDEPAYDLVASTVKAGKESGCLLFRSAGPPPTIWQSPLGERVLGKLVRSKTTVFSVTLDDNEHAYRELAQKTGGAFYDLSQSQDFTRLLDTLGKKIGGMFIEL